MALSFEELSRYSPEVAHQMSFVCAAFAGVIDSVYREKWLEVSQRVAALEKHYTDVLAAVSAHENALISKRILGIGPSLSPRELRARALANSPQPQPYLPQPLPMVGSASVPTGAPAPIMQTHEQPTAPAGLPFTGPDGKEYILVKQTFPSGQTLAMLETYDAAKHANLVTRTRAELAGEKLLDLNPEPRVDPEAERTPATPPDAALGGVNQDTVPRKEYEMLLTRLEALGSLADRLETMLEAQTSRDVHEYPNLALEELNRRAEVEVPKFDPERGSVITDVPLFPRMLLKNETSRRYAQPVPDLPPVIPYAPPPTIYRCDVCPQVFTTERACETHGVEMHDKPSPIANQALEGARVNSTRAALDPAPVLPMSSAAQLKFSMPLVEPVAGPDPDPTSTEPFPGEFTSEASPAGYTSSVAPASADTPNPPRKAQPSDPGAGGLPGGQAGDRSGT